MFARSALMVVVGWTSMAAFAAAAEKGADELKLTTERVIIFKDGYCLFAKRAKGTSNEKGEVFTEQVPGSAVLGSFWAVPKEGRLVSMNARKTNRVETSKKTVPCTLHIELLESNKGKACVLELNDNRTLNGTIREVLTLPTSTPAPAAALDEISRSALGDLRAMGRVHIAMPLLAESSSTLVSGVAGSLFVLGTEDGEVVIQVDQIKRLTIKGLKITTEKTLTKTEAVKQLTFQFEKPNTEYELLLMYFTPGIRWIPTYRGELPAAAAKEQLAQLALQAELLNEVEDLTDVPVDLVVGVPNFRFKTTISPLSLEAALRNVLLEAAPQLMGQGGNSFSNSMMTQSIADSGQDGGEIEGGGIQLPPELTAGGSQDLFIYKLPKLSLKKGDRAAVPIFSATAPVRSLYTWDLILKRRDIEVAPSGSGATSPLTLSQNQVWHQVELTNNTLAPWTTGAVLLMDGRQPLGQELLTYTSAGGLVRVPVTVSVDTRGTFAEVETARTLKALRWADNDYARIDKRGTLTLTNSKKVAIDAEISCRLGGRADEASHDGKVALEPFNAADWTDYRGHPSVNNHSTVTWRLKLKPGETVSTTVKYHYFVHY